jgi:hypothetical protein
VSVAFTNMALGDNAGLLTLADRPIPIEKDALTGPRPLDILARVAAHIPIAGPVHLHFRRAAFDPIRGTWPQTRVKRWGRV